MSGFSERYRALLVTGELKPDPDQLRAVARLTALQRELEGERGGFLARFRKPKPIRGAYLWGGVGRGKSMLMDLFHATLAIETKRRVHFHAFMIEVHQRLKEARESETGDPIPPVAAALAKDMRCLAFDELVVNNSADAMIMSRLFRALICDEGVTLVATSNRPPRDLYKDGLNREHFLPFIDLIERELDVFGLNGPTDYRLDRIGGMASWYAPADGAATAHLRELFFRLTDFSPDDAANVPSCKLQVGASRTLHVPKCLKGVAVFSFKRLCGDARGAPDYLAIARAFHTVIVVGIPLMGPDMRNEAARFVTLVDELYEHRVKLFASAAVAPEALYPAGDGSFEFARTTSRLIEMQSADYMAQGHGTE
ncbi:MAG: cell division protein ZapE [Croceibacterium sp.]